MNQTVDEGAGLAELARRNQELLTRAGTNDVAETDLKRFIADITAAGARCAPGPARDSLRNMLYFWTSELAARSGGSESSLPELADYREATAPRARPSSGEDANAARTRQILQIAALARQWKMAPDDSRSGYLLNQEALEIARGFADDDPDIRDLVRASDDFKKNSRQRRWIVGLGVALFFAIISLFITSMYQKKSREVTENQVSFSIEKQDFYSDIRNAIDALSQDNVDPLRRFLEAYGRANPVLMSRLILMPATAASLSASSTLPKARKFDAGEKELSGLGQCDGYIWLGRDGDSHIAGGQQPSGVKAGQTITIDKRASLTLRAGVPDDKTYALKPQVGTVPAGAKVKVIGDAQGHDRKMKDGAVLYQIWARVSVPSIFCASVFVRYFGDPATADTLVAAIDATGAQTPPQEQLSAAQGLSEIRYFFDADRKLAEFIVKQLKPVQARTISIRDLSDFPNKPKPGTLELWIDLS